MHPHSRRFPHRPCVLCAVQNFERGMGEAQLGRLVDVLKLRRIWAVNVGENFAVSREVS